MVKKIIHIILIIFSYILICNKIYSNFASENKKLTINTNVHIKEVKPLKKEIPIGYLIIEKINLKEELYEINSKKNNIEEHVTILKESSPPTKKNSTMFIAAHSGTGSKAFFKNLNKLSTNEKIILKYQNKTYTYIIKNIWEDKKTGTINVPKENTNQLILTTCSPTNDNYQLIINCALI